LVQFVLPILTMANGAARSLPNESTNLDFLRAVAVLAVLATHVLATFRSDGTQYLSRWELGRLGVLLFFVHTSFVLMQSLERLQLTGRAMWKSFAIRRVFRIYPLAITCVALVTVLRIPATPWREHGFHWFGWGHFLSNVALTQNLTYSPSLIGPLWSLPLELQMYAVLPLVFVLVTRRKSTAAVLCLWCLGVGLALVQPRVSGRLTVLQFAPCFLAGVVAYVLSARVERRLPGWLWPIAIISSAGFFLTLPDPYRAWIFCLSVGTLVPWFREISNPFIRRTSAMVAKYSYGIYLTHVMALWIGFRWLGALPFPAQALVAVAALVLLPFIGYHLIEEPFIQMGKRVALGRQAIVPTPITIPAPVPSFAMVLPSTGRRALARSQAEPSADLTAAH
jgi:peptidoglycan/LPS O-acetylase OafA/YrhL